MRFVLAFAASLVVLLLLSPLATKASETTEERIEEVPGGEETVEFVEEAGDRDDGAGGGGGADNDEVDEEVDEEGKDGEGRDGQRDNSCPLKAQAVVKIVGGKRVSVVLTQLRTALGCIWVLPGSSPKSFVNAKNCASCRVTDNGRVACSGSGTAFHPKCALARGPDCRLYSVGARPELPCDDGTLRVSACPPAIKTASRVLGGKTISQVLVQIQTRMGCIWVLQGGNSNQFVNAKNCSRCTVRGRGISCSGAGLMMHPGCRLERGPDCRLYAVGARPELPCTPVRRPPTLRVSACPPAIKTASRVLGGKTISQVLVQIQTRMGCIWVLQGGNSNQFVNAKNCSRCTVRGRGISCSGAGLMMHPRCRLERGPDCRLYAVGARPELPCK